MSVNDKTTQKFIFSKLFFFTPCRKMLFNSLAFAVFPLVTFGYFLRARATLVVLLLASCVFYMCTSGRFTFLFWH